MSIVGKILLLCKSSLLPQVYHHHHHHYHHFDCHHYFHPILHLDLKQEVDPSCSFYEKWVTLVVPLKQVMMAEIVMTSSLSSSIFHFNNVTSNESNIDCFSSIIQTSCLLFTISILVQPFVCKILHTMLDWI